MLVTQARYVAPDISGVSKSRVKLQLMHVYYPCPTIEVAGIGGMNLTSDGISFL